MKLLNPNDMNSKPTKAAFITGIVLSTIAVILGTICLVYSFMDSTSQNDEKLIEGAIIIFGLINIFSLVLSKKK